MERKGRCQLCHRNHLFKRCPSFRWMLTDERREAAKKCNLCLNCLTDWHKRVECTSQNRCSICGRRHHTMLHHDDINASSSTLEELPENPTVKDLKGYPIASLAKFAPNKPVNFYNIAQGYKLEILEAIKRKEANDEVIEVSPDTVVVSGVGTQTSKLVRKTMEYQATEKPHGANCMVIAPVVLCDLEAKGKSSRLQWL
ncbi:uncharacterized protein LOC142241226 [Haematobia irritans]|uniref:uncharacterized protein LOC142241226 n=1 Tax=Haematobia irritans TaxID=7368 RepID=UPI003F4F65D2